MRASLARLSATSLCLLAVLLASASALASGTTAVASQRAFGVRLHGDEVPAASASVVITVRTYRATSGPLAGFPVARLCYRLSAIRGFQLGPRGKHMYISMGFLYDDFGADRGLYSMFSSGSSTGCGFISYHLARVIEEHPRRFWVWIFAEGRGGDPNCRPCYTPTVAGKLRQ